MDKRSTYIRALRAHTRKIDDYESVHFRKSWLPKTYEDVTRHSMIDGTLDRPMLQPRVVEFSKVTAKFFLQQTKPLWLNLEMSRQDATTMLLDKPTGSFYVRESTRAEYALTMRLLENDPPVMHFLIHCNTQGFYSIQGSNLQFVSLYDLLAFFCFQQSGGMPCLLRPPKMTSNGSLDSEESDSGDEEWDMEDTMTSLPPPEYEIVRRSREFSKHPKMSTPPSSSNQDPPPVPPRRRNQVSQWSQNVINGQLDDVVNRVSSLVDNDRRMLIKTLERQENYPHLLDRPRRTEQEITPSMPLISDTREEQSLQELEVHQAYKNFQIIEEHFNTPETNQDTNTSAPVKEFVKLINPDDIPPLIPPKARPPPIPPRANQQNVIQETIPPPLPPKPHSLTQYPPPESSDVFVFQKVRRRRAASDSSVVSGLSEDTEKGPSSPPLPPLPPRHKEDNNEEVKERDVETSGGWTIVQRSEMMSPPPTPSNPTSIHGKQHTKWKKPRWAKKLNKAVKWRRKPRSRVKHFILDQAEDWKNSVFGCRVHYFIEAISMRSDPHQKIFSDVRVFMSRMRELLLDQYRVELLSHGMDSCRNFEHLLESTLQQCIIQPLYDFLYSRLKDSLIASGTFEQVREAINNAKTKTQEDLAIRSHLLVPNEKSVQEINIVFNKIKESYNAMRKMEYLLEAVRLTYEGVRDYNNPKKSMNDLGADDFLPIFVWVLAHTDFVTAEVEAEYMWGLAHPSLFNGEGGYYLTTMTSAVNVLKELCCTKEETDSSSNIPNMNSLRTQLPIYLEISEDPIAGQMGEVHSYPVLPTMTVDEVCEMIATKHEIDNPNDFWLFKRVNETATLLKDDDCPQDMNIGWELESYNEEERPVLVYMKRNRTNS